MAKARNRGMDHVEGGYLSFVDADDCLLPHAVSSFYEAAGNAPDVVVGNILHVDRKGASPFYRHLEEKAETLPSLSFSASSTFMQSFIGPLFYGKTTCAFPLFMSMRMNILRPGYFSRRRR